MSGESNLSILLKTMNPELQKEAFVFLSSRAVFPAEVLQRAVMVFREVEGMTLVIREDVAESLSKNYQDRWAMITLSVHSDLNAVGFLAAITAKLAEAGISVNPVSAYYHDHLFVPWERRGQAMKVLQSF